MRSKLFLSILSVLVFSHSSIAQNPASQTYTEISATAYETYYQSPDSVNFNIKIEQTAANSSEVLNSLDEKVAKLTQSLKAISPATTVSNRGDKFTPATPARNNGIKINTPFSVTRTLKVETSELAKLGKLIDAALQSGQTSVNNVSYFVKEPQKGLLEAIAKASQKAKEKAELTAKTLNVSLGSLLTADSNEEPNGEMLREKMQEGEDIISYGDKELSVAVTVKYSIK